MQVQTKNETGYNTAVLSFINFSTYQFLFTMSLYVDSHI